MPLSGALRIVNAGGRVIVDAWDRDEVRLTITKEAVTRASSTGWLPFGPGRTVDLAARAALDSIEPVLDERDNGIDVSTVARGSSEDVVVNFHYVVRMPRGSALAVTNGSGPVTVSGVEGGVHVSSGNGDVRCESVGGDVSADVENGALNFSRIAGPLDAHTANGAIVVDNATLEILHPIRCRTENGPIRLRAPHRGAYAVKATTLNGRVDMDRITEGLTEATLETLNGSIVVDGV
jgi:hypothetical protein